MGLLQLEDLNLSNNKIKSVRIPSNPLVLAKLKNLDLSMNEIATSPSNLSRLKSLRVVDLNHNAITEMPADLSNGFAPALKSAAYNSHKRRDKAAAQRSGGAPAKGSRRKGLPGDPRVVMSEGPDYGTRDTPGTGSSRPSRRGPFSHVTQTTVSYDENSDHQG